MIVKCDKCQTRFKIPDEKVTEKGVKVRCSRCQNTFRVARSTDTAPNGFGGPAPAPRPARSADPFAPFGSDLGEIDFSSPRETTVSVPIPTAPPPAMSNGAPPTRLAQLALESVPRSALELPDEAPPTDGFGAFGPSGGLEHDALFGDIGGQSEPVDPMTRSGLLDLDRAAFDMPAPRTHGTSALDAVARAAPEHLPAAPPPPRPRAQPPLRVVPPQPEPTSPGAGHSIVRGAGRVVANLAVASLLLFVLATLATLYLNQGEVSLSKAALEPVKALFAPKGKLVALDVSNGLYETQGGKPVFYVRGEVHNRGGKATPARVRVQILDGELQLTEAGAVAGKAPTPEELHAVESAEELAALAKKLASGAAAVKPGESVPFLVAFYEYPPDLSEYRLKITVEDAQGPAR